MRTKLVQYDLSFSPRCLFLVVVFVSACLTSCHYYRPNQDYLLPAKEGMVDSISFNANYHYWKGFKFQTVDTLFLKLKDANSLSTFVVNVDTILPGTSVVVADIVVQPPLPVDEISDSTQKTPSDSLWISVVQSAEHHGWLSEKSLRERAIPDDPISIFIYRFSGWRTAAAIIFVIIVAVSYFAIRRKDHAKVVRNIVEALTSPYAVMMTCAAGILGMVYGFLESNAPDAWQHFFYHPTINPFAEGIPFVLRLFVAMIWINLVLAVAAFDDVRCRMYLSKAIPQILIVYATSLIVYVVVAFTSNLYVGPAVLAVYAFWAIRNCRKNWKND